EQLIQAIRNIIKHRVLIIISKNFIIPKWTSLQKILNSWNHLSRLKKWKTL
ncbi:hypothetical protein RhiirC2_759209, partial [Rhizophagus irregularis]